MEFQNVRVVKKANVYFEGKVTSRTIFLESGEKKTLGFMLAGEYEFNTQEQEVMEILGGEILVMVKGEDSYTKYQAGESFVVPANSSFKLIISTYTDYCCSYQA